MIVFLECGAAAGGVGDDGVEVFTKEDGEVFSGEVPCGVTNAGVCGEGTAAELSPGDDDFATVGGENAYGGFIELRESDIRDASGEESDAGAARAVGGVGPTVAAIEKVVIDAREETFAIGETEKFQDADAARDDLQSRALIETENAREIGNEMRIGEQMAEDEITHDAIKPRTLVIVLDACARVFDEFAVFDTGRAGGFAGAAVEAFVDVIYKGIGDGDVSLKFVMELALRDVDHLVDASAGGIGFEIPEAIGGAGVEAEAAMDAAGVVLVDRIQAGDGGSGHGPICRERLMIRPLRANPYAN